MTTASENGPWNLNRATAPAAPKKTASSRPKTRRSTRVGSRVLSIIHYHHRLMWPHQGRLHPQQRRASLRPSCDHQEESALAVPLDDLFRLNQLVVQPAAATARLEEVGLLERVSLGHDG